MIELNKVKGTFNLQNVFRLGLIGFCLLFSHSAISDTFVMAFGRDPNQNLQHHFYKQIYTSAFKKLGYDFDYIICPGLRCSYMLDSGKVDGEPQRIEEYESRLDNVVRVKESIFINRTIAVGKKNTVSIDGIESLKTKNLHVDYLRGSYWSEDNLSPLLPPHKLHAVDSVQQGLNKVLYDRADVFVGLEAAIMRILVEPEFVKGGLSIAGILGQNASYPYVHKSHTDLADQLADVIKAMKSSGEYEVTLFSVMPFLKDNKENN